MNGHHNWTGLLIFAVICMLIGITILAVVYVAAVTHSLPR